jgi:hypothetical protein
MQEHNGHAFTGVDKADLGVENRNTTSRMIVFGTNRHGRILQLRAVPNRPDRQFQSGSVSVGGRLCSTKCFKPASITPQFLSARARASSVRLLS